MVKLGNRAAGLSIGACQQGQLLVNPLRVSFNVMFPPDRFPAQVAEYRLVLGD